ncbi:MAG: flagellar basal body rod protein FlgB [Thermoanaerobacteraceae bacterium]|nr:flagellar basal body rod protein FlgB [Thermoanaerobacteraceae bacterium]
MVGLDFGNINFMGKALDAAMLKNNVIANNIANVDTVGFKKSEVRFDEILKDSIDNQKLQGLITNSKHIPIGVPSLDDIKPQVIQDNNTSMRLDGNNVDIDAEMSNLAKNQIYYNAIVQRVNGELTSIMTAVKDGR